MLGWVDGDDVGMGRVSLLLGLVDGDRCGCDLCDCVDGVRLGRARPELG